MTPTFRQAVRRLGPLATWTTLDQILFAVSNLVVTIAVTRGGGAEALGRYAVAFAIYMVLLGFARSLVSEPLLTVRAGREETTSYRSAITITIVLGAASGLVLGAVGLALGRPEIVVVALTLPATLAQDTMRYVAFRQQRPSSAVLIDGAWVVVSLACWPLMVSHPSPALAAACWAAGGAAGALLGVFVTRTRTTSFPRAIRWWTAECKVIARPLLVDSALVVLSAQSVIFLLALVAGDSSVGLLRASQMIFTPLVLALTAAGLMLVPLLSRRPPVAPVRTAVQITVVLTAGTAALSVVLVACRELLTEILFAGAVDIDFELLVAAGLYTTLIAASVGFVVLAKVTRRGRKLVISRASSAVVGLVVFFWAAATFGVYGAAWALVAQAACYVVHLALLSVIDARKAADRELSPTHG